MDSTFIPGLARAYFRFKAGKPVLVPGPRGGEESRERVIRRCALLVEGVEGAPFIHLDLRTPFGEEVQPSALEQSLADILGPRKESLARNGWHTLFAEDTNLGVLHRIWVDLKEKSARKAAAPEDQGPASLPAGEWVLPLELALFELGDRLVSEKNVFDFQLLLSGPRFLYSVLFRGGSPFHLLRLEAGEAGPERLRRHRAFGEAHESGTPATLKVFCCKGDAGALTALGGGEGVELFRPAALEGAASESPPARSPAPGTSAPGDPATGASASGSPAAGTAAAISPEPGAFPGLYWHLGLLLAARNKNLRVHQRQSPAAAAAVARYRDRYRFLRVTAAAALFVLALVLLQGLHLRLESQELRRLREHAALHEDALGRIDALRRERARLEADLLRLQPRWQAPVDWAGLFDYLAEALPARSGIDGFLVTARNADTLDISFKVWVKDWADVKRIQERLEAHPRLVAVEPSEQRKDPSRDVVGFHLQCRYSRL